MIAVNVDTPLPYLYVGQLDVSDWGDRCRYRMLDITAVQRAVDVQFSNHLRNIVSWRHSHGFVPRERLLGEFVTDSVFWDSLHDTIIAAETFEQYEAIGERIREFLEAGQLSQVGGQTHG